MKLTGKLKEKVEAAETKEEMKDIISRAGMELTDDELDGVAGGLAIPRVIKKTSYKPFVEETEN